MSLSVHWPFILAQWIFTAHYTKWLVWQGLARIQSMPATVWCTILSDLACSICVTTSSGFRTYILTASLFTEKRDGKSCPIISLLTWKTHNYLNRWMCPDMLSVWKSMILMWLKRIIASPWKIMGRWSATSWIGTNTGVGKTRRSVRLVFIMTPTMNHKAMFYIGLPTRFSTSRKWFTPTKKPESGYGTLLVLIFQWWRTLKVTFTKMNRCTFC